MESLVFPRKARVFTKKTQATSVIFHDITRGSHAIENRMANTINVSCVLRMMGTACILIGCILYGIV